MAEQYEVDQSSSRVSRPGVVIRQEIMIINELGLHARPAAEFVLAAKAFRSQIWLVKGEERFSASSILEVLCANLNCGDTAIIEAEGRDAEEAVKRLAGLTREFGKRDSGGPAVGRRSVEEGDSMPPQLRKLLLPLLFEVAASPYLIADSIGMWHMGEERFWMPQSKFYAIALDGEGELCRVPASNAGHLLYTGLPSATRATHVTAQLLSATFDTGWGVRTVCDRAARFNPMSYHNGSVWPHDTGLCAAGLARYGDRVGIRHLLNETFAAAHYFGMRLPELLCGFARAAGEPPVGYPVACLPQAWSSGAPFMMLQAALGLDIDAFRREIVIDRPELPSEIERLEVRGLRVDDEIVNLQFQRIGDRVMASTAHPIPESVRVIVSV